MDVSYKREMNHNYMIIKPEDPEAGGYECRMLAGNHIDGLLKFRMRYHGDEKEYYYEITSRQPLERLLECRKINGREIRQLLLGVDAALRRIEEYLLKEAAILLEPQYIYIEPDQFLVGLCMIPGYSCDFPAEFSRLLQYILGKVDHQDKDAVVLAYNLYHESLKENYGMADLLSYLPGNREGIFEKEKEAPYEEEERWGPEEAIEERESYAERTYAGRGYEGHKRREPEEKEGRRRGYEGREAVKTEYAKKRGTRREVIKGGEDRERDRDRGGCGKRKKTPGGEKPWRRLGIVRALLAAAAGEILLWMFTGEAGIYRYGIWAGPLIAVFVVLSSLLRSRGMELPQPKSLPNEQEGRGMDSRAKQTFSSGKPDEPESREKREERQSWKIFFEEEEKESAIDESKREPETTLLSDIRKERAVPVLESLNRDQENIEITYVPFMIGKNKEMADYCLDRPTVSRLHLRLDQKEGVYIVTDLNSTNGTVVEGYPLQANETVSIKNGDTVYLADIGYRFLEQK